MLVLVTLEDMLVDDCADLMLDMRQFEDRREKHARIPDHFAAFLEVDIQKLFGSVLEDMHFLGRLLMVQLKTILTRDDVFRLIDALRQLAA